MSIANIVKSSLGPVGLDKMLVDDIGVIKGVFLFIRFFFSLVRRGCIFRQINVACVADCLFVIAYLPTAHTGCDYFQ